MADFHQVVNQGIENALLQLKAAQGGSYVVPTDAQIITAIGNIVYAQLTTDSVI